MGWVWLVSWAVVVSEGFLGALSLEDVQPMILQKWLFPSFFSFSFFPFYFYFFGLGVCNWGWILVVGCCRGDIAVFGFPGLPLFTRLASSGVTADQGGSGYMGR